MTTTNVGSSLPRIDGVEKVTGTARYTADVQLPGTLVARVLRSPYPHARILAIDASAARRVPGVHAVLTGADVAGRMSGRRIFDMPVLAHEVVRYAGEPVAAVAAEDAEAAERALALIGISYEPLPAQTDPLAAALPGAPLLHPDFNAYRGVERQETPSNIFVTKIWGTGDVDAALASAERTLERTYSTALVHQAYMESHTCLVRIREDGGIDVWAANKAPHYTKGQIAHTSGLSEDAVHLHPVTIGGDFGGKGSQMFIPLCYFLARASGRPVRMVMSYAEELAAGNPRHPAIVTVRSGFADDGTLVACEIVAHLNTGAYAAFVPLGFLPGPRHAVGPYRIPNARVVAHHVYTNKVPSGHMRGPGEPQTIFAMESHLDEIAAIVGLDPAAVRLRNVVRDGDVNGLGEEFHDLHGADTIEEAVRRSGYATRNSGNAGRIKSGMGMALGERTPGGGETHAGVTFRDDGSVVINTSIFEQGSGTYTTMRQMVADTLSHPLDRIAVVPWNTDETGFDSGAGASRNSRMASEAAVSAARAAREALLGAAADQLSCAPDDLTLAQGTVTRVGGSSQLSTGEIAALQGGEITGLGDYKDPSHAHVTAFTAQVAQVAVDTETGQVTVERLTSVHDAGRILNPMGHTGQIHGGVSQGLGYALLEELPLEDGRVTTLSLADYRVPAMADTPPVDAIAIESDSGVGPFQIKGIGENPLSPVAPAVANAIADAIGVRVRDLPLTAERVLAALRTAH